MTSVIDRFLKTVIAIAIVHNLTGPAPVQAQLKPAASAAPASSTVDVSQPAPQPTLNSVNLQAAISNYRATSDSASWDRVMQSFKELIGQPHAAKADAASIMHANPGLMEIGAKVIDAGGAKVWTFPKVSQQQSVLVQWNNFSTTQVPAGRRMRAVAVVSPRCQVLNHSPSGAVRDARIVHRIIAELQAPGKPKKAREAGRYLILAGNDKATGMIWLQSYRLVDGLWAESTDILSGIPPFLLQNVQGRAQFSGNDLVLNIAGKPESATETTITSKGPHSTSYKIVLHLVEGRYVMTGSGGDDGPTAVAYQFIQAVQAGRSDVAKAWLADGKLASIPNYLKLYGKSAANYKLIAMASPASGGSRFRLITYDKNDLILDVGKVKQQWAVKGLFIAPPDPFAQKLVNAFPSTVRPTPASGEKSPAGAPPAQAPPAH